MLMSGSGSKTKRRTDEHRDRSILCAVALQDHLSRNLQLPGPQKLPSLAPGAEPTLAQRLGLYPKPEKLLTQDEWDAIHGLARQRKHNVNACAICLEPFKNEQQVLLSCSHVFHAQCLSSFEQHTRLRACPLCRKQWYQKHIIRDAAEAYQHACAARIQAAVRGWLCRKHVMLDLMRYNPPQAARLKRQWAAGRLSETGRAVAGLVQQQNDSLEQLFSELDANLEVSRQLADPQQMRIQASAQPATQPAEEQSTQQGQTAQQQAVVGSSGGRAQQVFPAQRRQQQQQSSNRRVHHSSSSRQQQSAGLLGGESSARVAVGTNSRGSSSSRHHGSNSSRQRVTARAAAGAAAMARAELLERAREHAHTAAEADAADSPQAVPAESSSVDWQDIISRACQRGETDCAICLSQLARRHDEGVALLSCSHTFHMQCIVSFEQFERGRHGTATCPVCRAHYTKMCFAVDAAADDMQVMHNNNGQ